MQLTVGGQTNTGPRSNNQDWLFWNLDQGLFLVADGMGGHNAGEVAAHIAVETVAGFVSESLASPDMTWPFGIDPSQSTSANRLLTGIKLANRRVFSEGMANQAYSGMGTTLVAVLVADGRVTMAGVGDSRIYRLRDGTLTQLTRDDTWLAALKGTEPGDVGYANHPMRHVLTSVIGVRDEVTPAIVEEPLHEGDVFLLCTDGLHGALDDGQLAQILRRHPAPAAAAERLVDAALGGRALDNVTALVIAASRVS